MPTISPVQSVDVQGAIARAATRTGVDFDYLLAQARLESGLDPSAKARTSSATGLYQFIDSTWLRTLDRHGAKHGMDWADAAIGSNGRVADRATRDHLLSLRYDADTSSLMAAELTRENAAGLQTILGREAEPAELYLAHFMGLGGALYAHFVGFISPSAFDPMFATFVVWVMLIAGGSGTDIPSGPQIRWAAVSNTRIKPKVASTWSRWSRA